MTNIKLYDSAINAINGQSNPQPQVGNTQNVDIQDILELIKQGKMQEAQTILDKAGITSMTSEENGTQIITFQFKNRTYTIRYNPESSELQAPAQPPRLQQTMKRAEFAPAQNRQASTYDINNAAVLNNRLQEVALAQINTAALNNTVENDKTEAAAKPSQQTQTSETPKDTRIIQYDESKRPEDQFNEFLYQLSQKFPDIYKQFGNVLEECFKANLWNGHELDFLVGIFAVSKDSLCIGENEKAFRPLGCILQYAAGLTRDARTTFKTDNYIKEHLETTGDPARVNLLELMNYLLGDNEEGINFFYSASGKDAPIWETFTGTPGEYTRIGDSDYYEKDGKYYFFQNRFIEIQGQCYVFSWNTYNGEEGYRYSKLHPDSYERAREWINDPERNYMAWEVDLYEVQDAIKQAKANGANGTGNTSEAENTTPTRTYPSMPTGGVSADSVSEEDFYNNIKQEELDAMLDMITWRQDRFFKDVGIPVYCVEINDNGNLVIGDKFKEALKLYLKNLATEEEEKAIQVHYSNTQKSGAGSAFNYLCNDEFLNMLGLTGIPLDASNEYAKMYEWINNILDITNDDAKLNELVSAYCKSVGSTDGKTVSLETYYTSLANNNIKKPHTGTNTQYFKTEDDFRNEARIEAYLAELKEKYPDVYNEYEYYIRNLSSNGFFGNYYYKGVVNGANYISLQGNEERYTDPKLNDVLRLAAGITGNESYTEQRAKMTALFEKMGAQGNAMEVDITTLMNYLLGDNSTGVNYFDVLMSQQAAEADKVNNTKLQTGTPDSSIEVEVYKSAVDLHLPGKEKPQIDTEISNYLKDLLNPIYEKYFNFNPGYSSFADGYINFTEEREFYNPDSNAFAHIRWTWKDEATKQAFVKEVEAVINKALEQYSDVITSVIFDGQRVVFTTIYDTDKYSDQWYHSINYSDNRTGCGMCSYMANEVEGGVHFYKNPNIIIDNSEFEPAVDSPVIYTPAPKVIENNIPENPPVGVNGENLYKTAWDGIWASEDYVYLWDAKAQKYLAIHGSNEIVIKNLANGNINSLPFGEQGFDIDNILLSLVYGYNRTNVPTIFEKDSKFYSYDVATRLHNQGLEGLKGMLNEITFANNSTNSPAVQSSNAAPETEGTTTAEQKVTIKAEECLEEMEAAAQKLGLTGAKTNGLYYNFTNEGSYLYVWNPQTKKFKAFSINARNADGTINAEFTQAGKAIQRTEVHLYYEALLEAYKNGYNFTANFPWVCEKDGVYYEYDKDNGCFKKK